MTTYEYENNFIIYPHFEWWNREHIQEGGKKLEFGFEYSSGTNTEWMDVAALREKCRKL